MVISLKALFALWILCHVCCWLPPLPSRATYANTPPHPTPLPSSSPSGPRALYSHWAYHHSAADWICLRAQCDTAHAVGQRGLDHWSCLVYTDAHIRSNTTAWSYGLNKLWPLRLSLIEHLTGLLLLISCKCGGRGSRGHSCVWLLSSTSTGYYTVSAAEQCPNQSNRPIPIICPSLLSRIMSRSWNDSCRLFTYSLFSSLWRASTGLSYIHVCHQTSLWFIAPEKIIFHIQFLCLDIEVSWWKWFYSLVLLSKCASFSVSSQRGCASS